MHRLVSAKIDLDFAKRLSMRFPNYRQAHRKISSFINHHHPRPPPPSRSLTRCRRSWSRSRRAGPASRICTFDDLNMLKAKYIEQLEGEERELLENNVTPAALIQKITRERRETRGEFSFGPSGLGPAPVLSINTSGFETVSNTLSQSIPLVLSFLAICQQRFVPPQHFMRSWFNNNLPVFNFSLMEDERHEFNIVQALSRPLTPNDILVHSAVFNTLFVVPVPTVSVETVVTALLEALSLPRGLSDVVFAIPTRPKMFTNIYCVITFIFPSPAPP